PQQMKEAIAIYKELFEPMGQPIPKSKTPRRKSI
ncbi:hypothetical protein SS7213T_03080, partial [Staphylococcus simiae CCM 7213 = CCUG 51256]